VSGLTAGRVIVYKNRSRQDRGDPRTLSLEMTYILGGWPCMDILLIKYFPAG
jgi:hypothetical protein